MPSDHHRRAVLWPLLHSDVPWYATGAVRPHLRDCHSLAPIKPHFDWRAGPIWCALNDEDEWWQRVEEMPWTVALVIRRRGREEPADNDNDWPPLRL